jgi:hypothetical protein
MRRPGGRFGDSEETIGFATVFRANGEYLYNDSTPYCEGSSYEAELEETIKRAVSAVAGFEALQDGAKLRLIFHVPRRAGRKEELAILNAVGKMPRFKIEFALLHINDDHHIQVFDTANVQPQSRLGAPKPEGKFLAPRGLSIGIGPRERLVTFVGVDQYKGNGLPLPLRVTLDRRSTFKDIDYMAQQLYSLAFMNVGSLTPAAQPATILYAEKLARLTAHLRGIQKWTVDLITRYLGRKLWFI